MGSLSLAKGFEPALRALLISRLPIGRATRAERKLVKLETKYSNVIHIEREGTDYKRKIGRELKEHQKQVNCKFTQSVKYSAMNRDRASHKNFVGRICKSFYCLYWIIMIPYMLWTATKYVLPTLEIANLAALPSVLMSKFTCKVLIPALANPAEVEALFSVKVFNFVRDFLGYAPPETTTIAIAEAATVAFVVNVVGGALSVFLIHLLAVFVIIYLIGFTAFVTINRWWSDGYYLLALTIANIKPTKLIPAVLTFIDIIRPLILKTSRIKQTFKRYAKSILPVPLERIITLTQYHSACTPA